MKAAKESWTDLLEENSKQNPAFAYVENDPALPNVLLYGDSISVGYTVPVRESLKAEANVYRLHCNGQDSGRFREFMTAMHNTMRDKNLDHPSLVQWDMIHFNVGLHDILRPTVDGKVDTREGSQRTPVLLYKQNLEAIIAYLRKLAPNATLLFATTTPVPENTHNRQPGEAATYNEAARTVLKNHPDIVINDLHAFTKPHQPNWWTEPGNVHFNPIGQKAQGEEVARVIRKVLVKRRHSGEAASS